MIQSRFTITNDVKNGAHTSAITASLAATLNAVTLRMTTNIFGLL